MNEYVLILGANMPSKFGDILTTLQMCVEYIKKEEPIDLISQSKWYESESFPDKSKPTFINVGIKIISNLDPYQILKIIEYIDQKFTVEVDLRRENSLSIKRLIDLAYYRV